MFPLNIVIFHNYVKLPEGTEDDTFLLVWEDAGFPWISSSCIERKGEQDLACAH